ncbi:MAG: Glutamine amidotransferase of anthranilate synthase [Candidatus Peregrinibacteria bacterium GW2011_GWA2_33_10]|nr:MAG: Glutamine amidotransferase of anthranilate synthase [Candidatus Peregrinibacteria bacterium GW2011_GWA2_33_10]KKP38986.1 MAG: anthranilate synthase, anthranilate synthase [Candidatus Peregrinibacteria bacterium GW2011_GWC2_33_13]
MINYQKFNNMLEGKKEILSKNAHEIFQNLYSDYSYKFLFESKEISNIYGRFSIIGIDPVLHIHGKNENFYIQTLNERGKNFLEQIKKSGLEICDSLESNDHEIRGIIKSEENLFEETKRTRKKNIAQIIRIILNKFHLKKRTLLGLYGAFSYDFVRLFEKIEERLPPNETNDFDLFLYDTFVFFDHLKNQSKIIIYRKTKKEITENIQKINKKIENKKDKIMNYKITDPKFSLSKKQYEELVKIAKKYASEGEIFEIVFSNILKADFKGDPYSLYLKYRQMNPSPYLFYFDFKNEQLIGASPEMMVRVENNIVHIRPISGTVKRGNDPISDHENMLFLLTDKKERAELDMLIDLGRNDLSRICKPNLQISDYRFVEKYSYVFHTVSHISGELKDDFTAFDALISCLNAGTLTGAPKIAAMNFIEKHEKERRAYYGGVIGYLTFSGEMDTAIIIRTAHIKNQKLKFQVGATLLHRSNEEKEYQETINKAQAFLNTF